MPVRTWFEPKQYDLLPLLNDIHSGAVQLPDFQRSWVWDLERIRELLASVSQGWPIGAVLLLETGGEVKFRPRPFAGSGHKASTPTLLALDGQQRLTSLYLAMRSSKPVQTQDLRENPIVCWLYFDISACVGPGDRAAAIVDVPVDRIRRQNFNRDVVLDLSEPRNEYSAGMIPVDVAADPSRVREWRREFSQYHSHDRAKLDLWDAFEEAVVEPLQQYRVPAILMSRHIRRRAICTVFEKVNTGGKPLDVFELVTATWAGDDESFNLREEWERTSSRLHSHKLLRDVSGTDFLQALTLYHSNMQGQPRGKREDILSLPLDAWRKYAALIEFGLEAAAKLLVGERVFDADLLPYGAQLIPLSVIIAQLGSRHSDQPIRQKLAQWYWCGVFGELYGSATETRFVSDVQQVPAWIDSGSEPDTVRDCEFAPARLLTLRTRNSAAYKGLMAKAASVGGRDWLRGEELSVARYHADPIDIHHIFPKSWCQGQTTQPIGWDCVVNKTLLSNRTNRILRGDAPSKYLGRLEATHGVSAADLDRNLRSHLVDPDAVRTDNYTAFFSMRARRLLDVISASTGRAISGRDSEDVRRRFGDALPPAPPYGVDVAPLFGQYEVLRRVGTFGMSECFQVRGPGGATCFLKRVELEGFDAHALSREQSIYHKLELEGCETVLRVLGFERDGSHAALLLEWADGGTLADFAKGSSGRPFSLAVVREIGLAVLDALADLHMLEIVHRDLKPTNVLRVDGRWKLGDFGIARNLNRPITLYTFQGAGTHGFAAPEQLDGAAAHPSQDVYAFGKLVAWLLTGETDPAAISYPNWRHLATKCTHTNGGDRPTLDAVLHALEKLQA